jgi:hypothetical protein
MGDAGTCQAVRSVRDFFAVAVDLPPLVNNLLFNKEYAIICGNEHKDVLVFSKGHWNVAGNNWPERLVESDGTVSNTEQAISNLAAALKSVEVTSVLPKHKATKRDRKRQLVGAFFLHHLVLTFPKKKAGHN